jgi:glycosyltransferase involved in cell wall biosynthesis
MRVAFYSPLVPVDHASPSGDRQMARQFLKLLAMAGHDATVVSTLRSWSREASEPHLADLERRAAAERARIAAAWQESRAPDLWFTYHPYYKSPDLIGPALSARAGIPYVTAGASLSIKRQEGEWQPYQAIVASGLADAALNLYFAPRDRPGLAMVTASDRLAAFPPCLDIEPAPRRPPQQPPTIVTAAMARPGRKLHNFRIMASVLARIVELPWRLAVIGGGACQRQAEAAFSGFSEDRVSFLGQRPREEVFAMMAGADVYLWPGYEEAYGMAYLEAEAHGLPVAAWDTAGVPSVVRHDETGLLAAFPDEAALAEALARLLGDAALRRRLGEGARAFALGERSMGNGAARLGSLLAAVATERVA